MVRCAGIAGLSCAIDLRNRANDAHPDARPTVAGPDVGHMDVNGRRRLITFAAKSAHTLDHAERWNLVTNPADMRHGVDSPGSPVAGQC
jgi:hypothetical protein